MNRDGPRPPPEVQTRRLRLRPPTLEDAVPLFDAYGRHLAATRFLTWRTKQHAKEMEIFIKRAIEETSAGTTFHWVLETVVDTRPVGALSIGIEGHHAEIGFVLAPSHWGAGLMSEAVTPLLEWLKEQADIFRIWAYCDVENTASARVLEKLGFEREGILRRWAIHPNVEDDPRDVYSYSIIR